MCARYLVLTDEEIYEMQEILKEIKQEVYDDIFKFSRNEVFPAQIAPIVASSGVQTMKWGFPGFSGGTPIINARSETALEKKTFKEAMLQRRCIIPSNGFFEWQAVPGQKKKLKFLFNLPDTNMLYMAGIFQIYDDMPHFTILTTQANESVKGIHERMPLIIPKAYLQDWVMDFDAVAELLKSSPELLHIEVS